MSHIHRKKKLTENSVKIIDGMIQGRQLCQELAELELVDQTVLVEICVL